MANEQFRAEVMRFCAMVEDRAEYVAFGVAKELHTRLHDITPYYTGRARASWNIKAYESDDEPAPDVGWSHPFLTAAEVKMANTFYDSIAASKGRFQQVHGALVYHVTNTVHYIEKLNAGSSQQAPPAFFETTVFSAGIIADRVARNFRV